MSGSTKVWVKDIMYCVDDEVGEYIEELQSENNKRLERGEYLLDKNKELKAENEKLKKQEFNIVKGTTQDQIDNALLERDRLKLQVQQLQAKNEALKEFAQFVNNRIIQDKDGEWITTVPIEDYKVYAEQALGEKRNNGITEELLDRLQEICWRSLAVEYDDAEMLINEIRAELGLGQKGIGEII